MSAHFRGPAVFVAWRQLQLSVDSLYMDPGFVDAIYTTDKCTSHSALYILKFVMVFVHEPYSPAKTRRCYIHQDMWQQRGKGGYCLSRGSLRRYIFLVREVLLNNPILGVKTLWPVMMKLMAGVVLCRRGDNNYGCGNIFQ